MKGNVGAALIALLQGLYAGALRAFPGGFRAEFGEEMAAVFGERLATARAQGVGAVAALALREARQMPAALLRAHVFRWQKRRSWIGRLLFRAQGHSVFGAPPVADDGRFSRAQLGLETAPFFIAAALILWLTYRPPGWLPAAWRDPLAAAGLWAGLAPLPALLLGLARGMPRWAYPYGGLVAGYTLLAAAQERLVGLWGALLVAGVILAVMAAAVHGGERPLPPLLRRFGRSIALDWTRLSFGVFGAAPLFVLVAFDNGYVNERTPYLALALAVMLLTAWLYARRRRQDRQLAALLGGATLLLVPALLDHVTWRGAPGDLRWLVALWAWMVVLLLLPLLALPVQWAAPDAPGDRGNEGAGLR